MSLKVAVTTSTTTLTVDRGSTKTITCTAEGQPGLTISFKASSTLPVDSDIYKVEAEKVTNANINGRTTRDLKVTAIGSSIATAYTTCTVTDQTKGIVECEKGLKCSAAYPGITSSDDTKSFTVKVTGLKGKLIDTT